MVKDRRWLARVAESRDCIRRLRLVHIMLDGLQWSIRTILTKLIQNFSIKTFLTNFEKVGQHDLDTVFAISFEPINRFTPDFHQIDKKLVHYNLSD